MEHRFELGLGLEETLVVITGAAGHIGCELVKVFLAAGSFVFAIDITNGQHIIEHEKLLWRKVDVTDEKAMVEGFDAARAVFGAVPVCVCAVAGLDLSYIPHHNSIIDMPLSQWQRTMNINSTGAFVTAKVWLQQLRRYGSGKTRNASLIIFGSEAGVFGVPGNPDYAASKAAIQYGLVKSLAPDAANIFPGARVNAIAPGPVHTPQFVKEIKDDKNVLWLEAQATVAQRCSVSMDAIARTCLILSSERWSYCITGQCVSVDNGKNGRVLWDTDKSPTWLNNP